MAEKRKREGVQIYYFDFSGKAEALRLLCAHGELPFEDVRLTREQFVEKKASGELPFGQVPALRVETGELLVQSAAIARYIGKRTGLYPDDPVVAARVDALLDSEADLRAGLTASKYQARYGFESALGGMGAEGTAKVRKALNDEVLPRHLGNLERAVADFVAADKWAAGTAQPTVADFVLCAWSLPDLQSGSVDGIATDILAPYPSLNKLIERFGALPSVAKWRSEH
eukprot:g4257.t1